MPARVPYVTAALSGRARPGRRGVSDWMRAVPDQISRWVPGDYSSLGTDGFGRSDTRGALRRYFHVDAESIVVAVLSRLVRRGEVKQETLQQAVDSYKLTDVTRGRRRQHRRRHLAAAVAPTADIGGGGTPACCRPGIDARAGRRAAVPARGQSAR